ncbi:excalibur calcium-binding domain-containing protein [Mycetocola saprophilus]|uniref:excalibur calcium-binding domain-containing protein n=1 Tax=Mycetocola saprophilus TaxID=76636 RepID=UPI003BEFCD2A
MPPQSAFPETAPLPVTSLEHEGVASPRKPFFRRWWVITLAFLLVLGLGSAIGGATSRNDREALKEENASLVAKLGEAQARVKEQQVAVDDATKAANEAKDKLKESTSLVDQKGRQVTDLEAQVSAQTARVGELEAAVAAAQAAAQAKAPVAPQQFAATPPKTQQPAQAPAAPPAQREVYYKNCAAARAAGAAPVYAGQPGYGRHLDRDGDGIGCE